AAGLRAVTSGRIRRNTMRLFGQIAALAVLVAFAAQLSASSPNVGQEAPAISVSGWALNAPENFDGSNLKGKVTLVEYWGQNCPPCKALIPHLNNLWEEY